MVKKKKRVFRPVRLEVLESDRRVGEPVFAREFTKKSRLGAERVRRNVELDKRRYKDVMDKVRSQRGKISRQASRESSLDYGLKQIRESGRSAEVKTYYI